MESFDKDPNTVTLEEAKAWLRARFEDGAECPCCTQFVKLYKRKLNSSMARGLIVLYHHQVRVGPNEWVHIPSLFREKKVCSSNDGALLRFWDVIERQGGEREDGSDRIGYYRITDLGRAFVEDRVRVPKYVYLYNQEPIGRKDPTTISIQESLGSRFSYSELMNA